MIATAAAAAVVRAQQQGGLSAAEKTRRWDVENELQSIATIERKVMMPMPDGVRLATDIYRPKSAGPNSKVPIVWVEDALQLQLLGCAQRRPGRHERGAGRGEARLRVRRAERARALLLGRQLRHPRRAADATASTPIDWMTKQPWSNGKVGTTGCSSTAEYQMGVAALGHPGYAAMNVQGFGAGVGRVGPYYEQGNWYRGGAVQMLFIAWLYGQQNQVRPMFPPNTSREDLIRASKSFDLAQHLPPVDWSQALWHLPTQDILKAVDAPRGIFADSMPVETGGRMMQRTPNDPAWYRGGLYHDDMKLDVPGLWFMSWYDVSVGPNLALYNHVRKTASPRFETQQWAVIAPVAHCAYTRATARHGRRRAQHGRRAPRLQRDRLRLLRSLPEGRAEHARSTRCRRSPTSRWVSTSGRRRTRGRRPARSR